MKKFTNILLISLILAIILSFVLISNVVWANLPSGGVVTAPPLTCTDAVTNPCRVTNCGPVFMEVSTTDYLELPFYFCVPTGFPVLGGGILGLRPGGFYLGNFNSIISTTLGTGPLVKTTSVSKKVWWKLW